MPYKLSVLCRTGLLDLQDHWVVVNKKVVDLMFELNALKKQVLSIYM